MFEKSWGEGEDRGISNLGKPKRKHFFQEVVPNYNVTTWVALAPAHMYPNPLSDMAVALQKSVGTMERLRSLLYQSKVHKVGS